MAGWGSCYKSYTKCYDLMVPCLLFGIIISMPNAPQGASLMSIAMPMIELFATQGNQVTRKNYIILTAQCNSSFIDIRPEIH